MRLFVECPVLHAFVKLGEKLFVTALNLHDVLVQAGNLGEAFLLRGFGVLGVYELVLVTLVLRRKPQVFGQIPFLLERIAACDVDVLDLLLLGFCRKV